MPRRFVLLLLAMISVIRTAAFGDSFYGNTILLYKDYSPSFLEQNREFAPDAWGFLSRTDLSASYGRLTANLQLDANGFETTNSNASLHKWFVQYARNNLKLTA